MSIEELKTKLAQVERKIVDLKKEENGLKSAIAALMSRFAVGDTIEYPYGRGMRKGVISRIHPGPYDEDPNVDVRTILASNKTGAIHTVHWFDHNKCKLVSKGGAA